VFGTVTILNNFLQTRPLFEKILCLITCIPETWTGYFCFQLRYALFFRINVKGTSSAQGAYSSN
jgi:hypothetical protein